MASDTEAKTKGTKRKEFCPVDYEHVRAMPTLDGQNAFKTVVTKKYKLGSLDEWINVTCEDMKDFLNKLDALQKQPIKAHKLLQDFRDVIRNSYPKEVFQLPMGKKLLSKNNMKNNLLDDDEVNESEKEEAQSNESEKDDDESASDDANN